MIPTGTDKKLLRMLSSDTDGEVLAAASAIKRTLAAEGSDIHALADTLCRNGPKKSGDKGSDWHSIACDCQAHGLSQREQNFVADMVAWTAFREPTQKQQAWLLSIHRRVGRHG